MSLTSFYLVKLMHLCDGRAKIGPARKPLSDFMEHDCPSALIMSAVVHVTHCPSGILGHGHSASVITYTAGKHFLPFESTKKEK